MKGEGEMRSRNCVVIGLAFALLAGVALAQTIPNWTAPPTWTPSKGMTATTMADLSNPVPFIPVTPCRVADTRNPNGAYGGPALVGALTRSFTIGGQCGIPSGAEAVSFNFTITGGTQAGDLRFYPAGSVLPLVSTINWGPTTGTLANAAVVPLGTAGAITVKNDSAASVHLIIDVNGYYSSTPAAGAGFYIYASADVYGLFVQNTYASGYGAYISNTGTGDGLHIQTYNSTTDALHVATGASVPAHSGDFSGGFGVLSSVSQANADAFYGVSSSATGVQYGVVGSIASTTNDAAGVYGLSSGGSGLIYGVFGQSSSTTNGSAAVFGLQGAAFNTGSYYASGVRGESANGYGVLGISKMNGIQGILADPTTGGYLRSGRLGYSTYGVYSQGDFGGTGAKYFVEPHPTDPTKVIKYVALEGPEAGTYFRGRARFEGRTATIDVPENFRLVTDPEGLSIQVTPIGGFASVYVEYLGLNQIVVRSTKDVEFYYTVNGVRKAFKDFQPIAEGSEFQPERADESIPAYLTSEARKSLIANGTYNADGTVNLNTAERLGWAQKWRDREAAAQKAAEEAAAKAVATNAQRAAENSREPR
jgi:hypothetical protein